MIKFSFHISYWGLCHRLFFSSLLFKSYGDLGILFSENDGIFYILYYLFSPIQSQQKRMDKGCDWGHRCCFTLVSILQCPSCTLRLLSFWNSAQWTHFFGDETFWNRPCFWNNSYPSIYMRILCKQAYSEILF